MLSIPPGRGRPRFMVQESPLRLSSPPVFNAMRLHIPLVFLVSFYLHLVPESVRGQFPAAARPASTTTLATPLLAIDFATFSATVRDDLKNQGFTLEKDIGDEDKITLLVEDGLLRIETFGQAFGFMVQKDLHIDQADWLEIEWGVDRYPAGADWGRGNKYEAVMVVLFFGEPLPANHLFLPDLPRFLGMFLGRHEPTGRPFISKNYTATGRYVCLGNPEPGQRITSRLNLPVVFRQWFGDRVMPPISGIAIEVDTGDLPAGETSSAFIKRISLARAE